VGASDTAVRDAHIDFVYDVVCPYAYLASTQIAEAAAQAGLTVRWRPILLGGLFREIGAPNDPNEAMAAPKAALNRLDMQRWACLYDVPLRMPAQHPRRTVNAMRLCTAAPASVVADVSHALFAAYWEQGQDVASPSVLVAIARAHGVDPSLIEAPETKRALREATARAHHEGMFGVPSFGLGERFWWGQDRLDLALASTGAPGLVDRGPQSLRAMPAAAAPPRVSFFHDFASPFSYLAAAAIDAVAARHSVHVEWVPILLGALFRAVGTPDVPLFEMSKPRQAYVRQDLVDWAAARGVPYAFPSHFPMRTVLPLRVATHAPDTTAAIYRAAWADDRRIDDADGLMAVLSDAGFDPVPMLAAAQTSTVKDALRANTARAQKLGACGVPTVVVQDDAHPEPLVLWGQDRLGMLDAVLSGWWPASG